MNPDDVLRINSEGWDRRVAEGDVWTVPVSSEEIARARQGDWAVVLTPNKPVPRRWFGDVVGRDILCLASGGGQQGPILSAAGARVTEYDASAAQLAQDEMVAGRDGLPLATTLGFMDDLSAFEDGAFDLILHPVSNSYAPEIEPVWRECFQVLRPGGVLLAGFMNPIVYVFDAEAAARGDLIVRHRLPFADVVDRSAEDLERVIGADHTVEFSHTLETQIGGQLDAGFHLVDFFEDVDRGPPARGRSLYFPTCMATRALKAVFPADV